MAWKLSDTCFETCSCEVVARARPRHRSPMPLASRTTACSRRRGRHGARKTERDQRGLFGSAQSRERNPGMHICPRRRRIPLAIPVLWVAALLAICCSGTAIAAVSSSKLHPSTHHPKPKSHRVNTLLAGTWSGRYSGAFSGTFTLHWTLSRSILSGSIMLTNPSGKYSVGGSVHGSAITFGAVGAGATYKGSVSGTSMSGTYQTPQGGGSWSAHKTS